MTTLDSFLDVRETLRASRAGDGGLEVCHLLSSSLDVALRTLSAHAELGTGVSIVATGGYGRSELSLFSDIDLMILSEEADPSDSAASVFRPLWDAGLRVGHSVRTVKEAVTAAKDRFENHTNLLTSRLVAGDELLYERFRGEIASITRARPLRRHLVAEERRRRDMSPYLAMATDVKNGRGGLRTAQGFEWERTREGLIGRFSASPGPEEAEAYRALIRIRNALHASAGRRYDTFSLDLREPASKWLGQGVFEVASDLVGAVEAIDSLASKRWPELLESVDSRPTRAWARAIQPNRHEDDGVVDTLEDLCRLLRSGEPGRLKIGDINRAGDAAGGIPELGAVAGLPQLAPFHEHPVESHLWRTVEEMQRLIEGDDHFADIGHEVGDIDLLTLSAFLHDIGKGGGGDHSAIGADIASKLCERLAMPTEDAVLVSAAVKHHLLLPETATRRDLDDPAVIQQVANQVGSLKLLQVLYLLTVADSRATGPTMWGPWKAMLLRTLFMRCASIFGGERLLPGTTSDDLMRATNPDMREVVRQHVDLMPADYLQNHTPEEVLWHTNSVASLSGSARVDVKPDVVADSVVVVGRGRPNFRRIVAQVFAANGLDVLEARLMGRSDGVTLDTYVVRDDVTTGPVTEEKWGRVRSDISSALTGALDVSSLVTERARVYSDPSDFEVDTRVEIATDETSGDGVITIKCPDRVGRLAEILGVLDARGIAIRLAKLDTRAGEVVDTFHVDAGSLPEDSNDVDILCDYIQRVIST